MGHLTQTQQNFDGNAGIKTVNAGNDAIAGAENDADNNGVSNGVSNGASNRVRNCMQKSADLAERKVLLNLGQGDWQTGFSSVTAQLWDTHQPIQFVGALPPAPDLASLYQRWRQLYDALYGIHACWRREEGETLTDSPAGHESADREPIDYEPTDHEPIDHALELGPIQLANVSQRAFQTLCETLKMELNEWLSASSFATIERSIRTQLSPQMAVRLMLTARSQSVLRFPWRLWTLFDDYPKAELSLSLPSYGRSLKQHKRKPSQARILAILGDDTNIDVETDGRILNRLPAAQVTLLAQPTVADLQRQLWQQPWDMLFFAGHSSSHEQGYLQVNATESLTVEQLKYALRQAIANGLQLAILNSCDGLGLAWDLADLHLPQTIVMREPVPDVVAHQFLKDFLIAFSNGQPLYSAVREAREKLHGLRSLGTCDSWLPIIVQNPAEDPATWRALTGELQSREFTTERSFPSAQAHVSVETPVPLPQPQPAKSTSSAKKQHFIRALSVAATVLGLRWLGGLQGLELQTYDALIKLRPTEAPDPRLVIITISERDIQSQTSPERRGSLSDETLLKVLNILDGYEPRVIGLDLYRDFAATTADLKAAIARPNTIGICKSLDPVSDPVGIGPPPELSKTQVGFSDFIEESDGIVRRQILTLTPDPVSPCTSAYGFAALSAIHYLKGENITAAFTPEKNLKLGDTELPKLTGRFGGLQRFDDRGNQIWLNYRALPSLDRLAAKVPLDRLLSGEVNADLLRDRLVLIGVTATSGDFWATPYGTQAEVRTPGVYIQAQMISQLISAAVDGRPLIWVWPQWAEALCILLGAGLGSALAWRWRSGRLAIACLLAVTGITLGAWIAIAAGGWLPLVPTAIALSSTAAIVPRTPNIQARSPQTRLP